MEIRDRPRGPSLLLAALLLAAWTPPTDAQILFTDVSAAAGVDGDQYHSTTAHSLGVNWIDFDLDGWPDLFAVGGGPDSPPHLFRNAGNGTFEAADDLLPILPGSEMSGSVFADYDRDGDPDIFVYTDNWDWRTRGRDNPPDGPRNLLLHNLWVENGERVNPGQPLFEERAATAGLEDLAHPPFGPLPAFRTKTAAWLDYDRDGCIDLYVGHLVMNLVDSDANRDRLFRNRCDGTFEDVSAASGLQPGTDPGTFRPALAAGGFHLDGDLWPDLYVVNVAALDPQPFPNDLIYRNQGPDGDGVVRFSEVSGEMPGLGNDAQAGMGIDVADVDLDGDWDLYITDLLATDLDDAPLGNVLYLGDGAGGFHDNSAPQAGVIGDDSWGANFFDADLDGWEDLYVSTLSTAVSELFFHNQGTGEAGVSFVNVAASTGIATGNSRGSAVADYDRDGDLDLAVVNQGAGLQLFRNDTPSSGSWLILDLVGEDSNPDAIGAIVEATVGEVRHLRQVVGGSSAHSQDELAVHFGLGGATVVDRVRILWPSGTETLLKSVAVRQRRTIRESHIFADGFETGDLSAWTTSGGG